MLVTYSNRFSYSGMKGTFPDTVKKGVSDISGTTGPKAVDTTVKAGAANPAAPADGDYDVEYTMQTGLTRFAPMQPVPSKKITATGTPKPLYPTSSVVIAKSRLPIPSVQTTITQSQTYSVSSRANTVRAVYCRIFWQCANQSLRLLLSPILLTIWPNSSIAGRTRRPKSQTNTSYTAKHISLFRCTNAW